MAGSGYRVVMELRPFRGRGGGIRQIGEGPRTLHHEGFEAIAESPSPLLDATMPRLSRAADHSKLWLFFPGGVAPRGGADRQRRGAGRGARRGAGGGGLSLAVTSLFTNQVAKRVWRRPRPNRLMVPLARRTHRSPTSNSLP